MNANPRLVRERCGVVGAFLQEAGGVYEIARARGCPKVQLQVRPDNMRVVDLCRHLGYEPYEAVSMGKRLDGPSPAWAV